jgi:hypothetical protein
VFHHNSYKNDFLVRDKIISLGIDIHVNLLKGTHHVDFGIFLGKQRDSVVGFY